MAPIDDALGRLPIPVLIMNGEHDLPDFMAAAAALAAMIPGCRRHLVPDGGGFPLWEYPIRVNDTVAAFLDEA